MCIYTLSVDVRSSVLQSNHWLQFYIFGFAFCYYTFGAKARPVELSVRFVRGLGGGLTPHTGRWRSPTCDNKVVWSGVGFDPSELGQKSNPWPSMTCRKKICGDHPRETPPTGELNTRGVAEYSDFWHIERYISETVHDKLLLITNRKSHMSFRLVPNSVTLDDLEWRISHYIALFHWIW